MSKYLTVFLILTSLILSITGCKDYKEEYTKGSGYSVRTLDNGDVYHIIQKDYEQEYSIQEVFSHNYKNNTYPELKNEGIIFDYSEYKEYCDLFGVEPAYTDENLNYIVVSYGSGGSWVDVRLADVEFDDENKNVNLYLWVTKLLRKI